MRPSETLSILLGNDRPGLPRLTPADLDALREAIKAGEAGVEILQAVRMMAEIIDKTDGVFTKDGGKVSWKKIGRIEAFTEALRAAGLAP